MPTGVLLGKEPGKIVQRLALHSWVFNAKFGTACDARSHHNFSLTLCMLTRKLHTTKILLFSPVISLWQTSGRTHQGAPLKASTWLTPHLKHICQHKTCLKIPCLPKTHCTRGVELCLLATARCCFITWNCRVFLSTDYSIQLAFTDSWQNYKRSSTRSPS